jgi:hypothetical protein
MTRIPNFPGKILVPKSLVQTFVAPTIITSWSYTDSFELADGWADVPSNIIPSFTTFNTDSFELADGWADAV